MENPLGISRADLSPPFASGRLGRDQYTKRRDSCTKQHLNQLMTSQEYKDWVLQRGSRQNPPLHTSVVESLLAVLAVLVVVLLLLQRGGNPAEQILPEAAPNVAQTIDKAATDLRPETQNPLVLGYAPITEQEQVQLSEQEQTQLSEIVDSSTELLRDESDSSVSTSASAHALVPVEQPRTPSPDIETVETFKKQLLLWSLGAVSLATAIFFGLAKFLSTRAARQKAQLGAPSSVPAVMAKVDSPRTPIPAPKDLPEPSFIETEDEGFHLATTGITLAEERRHLELEYVRVRSTLDEVRSTLEERDEQLLALNQELLSLSTQLKAEVSAKEESANDARRWLDEAQGQLQNTQAALKEKEWECKELSSKLKGATQELEALTERTEFQSQEREVVQDEAADLRGLVAAVRGELAEARAALLERQRDCSRLALQLEQAQQDTATLKERLSRSEQREAELEVEQEVMQAELQRMIQTLKVTRVSLAGKLGESQSSCAGLAAKLQQEAARPATPPPPPTGAPAERECLGDVTREIETAANSPLPCQVQRTHFAAGASEEVPVTPEAVLLTPVMDTHMPIEDFESESLERGDEDDKENVCLEFTTKPAVPDTKVARQRVHDAHAKYGKEITGFLRELGFAVDATSPSNEADFQAVRLQGMGLAEMAAKQGADEERRAMAGEAFAVLKNWQWPARRPAGGRSPYWFARGG